MTQPIDTNEIQRAKDDHERVLRAIRVLNAALPILKDRDLVVYRQALNFLQEHSLYGQPPK